MPTGEKQRVGIPPGDVLRLFEEAEIKSATIAAAVQLTNYVSDRSVALLIRERPDKLQVGSGVCVRIGDRYLVATVRHNLQDDNDNDLQISDIEIRSRGEKYGEPLKVRRMDRSPTLDLGWLELDPEASKRPHLAFVTADQIATLQEERDQQPCFLLGYPARMAEKPPDAQQRPLLESAGVLTLSIAPARRRSPGDQNSLAIEWPPHDGSLDDSLPEPHGVSGGGVWLLPRHDDYLVWSPERGRLVAIARAWRRDQREEVVTPMNCWLGLVADQIPELGHDVEAILARIHS